MTSAADTLQQGLQFFPCPPGLATIPIAGRALRPPLALARCAIAHASTGVSAGYGTMGLDGAVTDQG